MFILRLKSCTLSCISVVLSILLVNSALAEQHGRTGTPGAAVVPVDMMVMPQVSRTAVDAQLFRFVPNRGQLVNTDGDPVPDVLYYADAGNAQLYFMRDQMSVVFTESETTEQGISEATGDRSKTETEDFIGVRRTSYHRLDIRFTGCNHGVPLVTGDRLDGYTNYYYAHCPQGIAAVPGFATLLYEDIYSNIDLRFRIIEGRLKYEFIVHPGGNVSEIRLRYSGATRLVHQLDGGIEVHTALGSVRESEPLTYQQYSDNIPSSFLVDGTEVRFAVQKYDRARDLIIDPWVTYYGGSMLDAPNGAAIDGSNNVIVAGFTESTNFPVQHAVQTSYQGGAYDPVIIKVSPGGVLQWATYYGGSEGDGCYDVAADASGDIVVIGSTGSTDFPTRNAIQPNQAGNGDSFLVKLGSTGTVQWSTYFGGSGQERFSAVAMDENGSIFAGATTESSNFPLKKPFQNSIAGNFDIVLFKLTGTGALEWSTYYGGSALDYMRAIDVDANGNAAFSGLSRSGNIPLPNQSMSVPSRGDDLIIGRISSSGHLIRATRYGGSGYEGDPINGRTGSLACGPDAMVAITAGTNSTDLPVRNAIYSSAQGGKDALIAVLDSSGRFVMGGYLGGNGGDEGLGITFYANGRMIIAGSTSSSNFPLVAAQQTALAGSSDAFVTRADTGGGINWSTYFGGSALDIAEGVLIDNAGRVVVAGSTTSSDLPVQNPIQASNGGGQDIMILSFFDASVTPPDSPSGLTGAALTYTKALLNWADNSNSESSFVIEHHAGDANWQIFATTGMDASALTAINLQPDQTHYFRVKAINALYESDYSNTIQITMPVFPAPGNLTADSVSFSSLLLQWQDRSDHEDAFVIEKSESSSIWKIIRTVEKDSTSIRITGLAPLTYYRFRVYAVEGSVPSPSSNVASITTLDLFAPANLAAKAHSAVEVRLTWEDRIDGESGFLIEFRPAGGVWQVADTVSPETEEWLVSDLQPATSYEFRVRTLSNDLQSAASNIAQATTLLYLAAPTNLSGVLMSETNIVLNWEDNATGESGYEIEHRENDNAWVTLHTTHADASMYDVQGLTPRTANRFRVRAVGDQAASGYSNVVTIETRMKPARPLNLSASAVDHTSIRVTWQRGSENEDGYDVERKQEGGSWDPLTTEGPGDGDILDENLPKTTTFWYRVRAKNDQGVSDWSKEDSATTMDSPIPSAPFGLRAEAAGPTSIRLHWILPTPSFAETIEIEMSPSGDPGSFYRILPDADGKAVTYTVTQLQPVTEYWFRVRAVNGSGASDFSGIASARTQKVNFPSVPRNVAATALSDTQIEISWEMPDPSKEDGFNLERSLTGDTADFQPIAADPGAGIRTFTDGSLSEQTTYYYRIRAFNTEGISDWSEVVSATTMKEPLPPELRAAFDSKEQLIARLETMLPAGDANMADLRTLFGSYDREFDESEVRSLITGWRAVHPENPVLATDAMRRCILFEESILDSWGDAVAIPPVSGARDIALQAGRAGGILSKNLIALALAWKQEREYLQAEDVYVTAGMEDVTLSLADNLVLLHTLMGSKDGADMHAFMSEILRNKGDVPDLTAPLMLSTLDYWQERMLGRYFIPAVNPLIGAFAQRTEQLDITGTQSDAETKRDAAIKSLRGDVDALSADFSEYSSICYGLDAAYPITQTAGNPRDIFMLKLRNVRPRLVDGMHDAIARAGVPVERFLFLTSPDAIPDLGSMPAALRDAGEASFDPVNSGMQGGSSSTSRSRSSSTRRNEMGAVPSMQRMGTANAFGVSDDRDMLIQLRGEVLDADTDYITAHFDALRRSGQEMIAEVSTMQRPLLGIAPADMYAQQNLRADYYGVLARAQLLKTRRAVLSVALADYVLGPGESKQTALVAEIDSIIGPLDAAVDDLTTMVTGTRNLMTLPALSLVDADMVRNEASGSDRCRIRFTVKNVGGAEANSTNAGIDVLTAGVTVVGDSAFSLGTLQAAASARDSMDVDIPKDITHVTISAALETGGRSFVDRRTIPVPPPPTTGVDASPMHPASCVLHQNYPNPFNPATTISYTLARPMRVSLIITDALGRVVARPVTGTMHSAGRHAIRFDAANLPSGVYSCRLETADAVLMRRMVLAR